MNRLIDASGGGPIVWLLAAVLVLLVFWLWYRRRLRRAASVEDVIRRISYDYLSNFVVPKADEGEIHIDHLLLTAEGLLIIDVKDVQGIVFGSDKMQDWTVIGTDRRYTFGNPQPGLFDRIAAVRQIVKQVPVAGRIVFLPGADFTKGVPGMVCQLDDLLSEFGEADKLSASAKIDAFKPHWERVRETAAPGDDPSRHRGRGATV